MKIVKKNDISLYYYYETNYNLNISRLFNISTYYSESKIINRPNYKNINKQIALIPPGSYNLIDDDTFTGNTIKNITILLNKNNIKINDYIYINKYIKSDLLDLLDCRDLLIGRTNGGLVVKLPNNKICRVPYLLPYVYPSSKLSISEQDDIKFSINLWLLNYEFYKNKNIYVKDVDSSIKDLLLFIGFNLDHPLSYICKCHILYLE